jgi:hypothetical protein
VCTSTVTVSFLSCIHLLEIHHGLGKEKKEEATPDLLGFMAQKKGMDHSITQKNAQGNERFLRGGKILTTAFQT